MGQTKKQKIVIADIDGFIADFEGAFCEAFGNKNRHLYDLTKRYPEVDPELIKEWVNDEENYKNLNPIFGGITLLNQLKTKGYRVVLATSRPQHLVNVTSDWLDLYNIEVDYLFTGIKDKYKMFREDVDFLSIFIDDDIKQLQDMKIKFPNTVCLAWAQPWNDGYFPRAIYNQETMKIMVNMGDNNWKWLWSKK